MEQDATNQNYIENLFTSKELYRILYDNAADAMFFAEKLKIVDCNKTACSMLGFRTKDEIIGRFMFDFYPELQPDGKESKGRALELIALANKETTTKFNWNYLKSDNTLIDTEVTINSFSHENRNLHQFAVRDVSFLRNSEKELVKAESKYKKIFENVQDVFYRTDLNGIITEISPSIERYSKYIHNEVIGKPIDKFYHNPDDRVKLINEIVEKGEAHDFEVLLKRNNNQLAWGSVNAHFILDESGQITGVEGTIRDLSDRKLAEAKSKHSLSLLQATLDSTADGILVVNQSGKITNYNKQFKQMFNLTDEILESGEDTTTLEFVMNQFKDPTKFINKFHFLYNNPELENFDTLTLIDGRIHERFSCPQLLDGIPIGRVWSFRDITIRKKAESQLHLMAHTLKSINECISITDINDRILFINAAFLQTYGYTEEELIGQNISIVRSPDNNPEVVNKIHAATAHSGWQGEILNRKKNGSDFPISLSTTAVKNEYGEILGMVGIASDISERKRAEIDLRDSETRFRNLFRTMPDGVYRSTPEGKFVEVNPAMVKMLGYDSIEELMAIDIKSQLYFDPTDRESLVLQEKMEEMGIFRLKKKDGSAVWVEDHGWYLTDETGNVIFHEGISRDITDRKMAEIQLQKYSEELQEMNATKDKLFSIIAHDLKSPFNSVIGLSEIIKNEASHLDSATIQQYAEAIYATSLQTFRLLENLLDWARIQQSQMTFRPVKIVLKDVVEEVIELLVEMANSKKIDLINCVSDQIIVSADQDMLKTILRNLVSNALKFTFANGKVEIQAFSQQGKIEITVKDTGTGIKKEDLDNLFKVGSKSTRRGTENEDGTGLGLILCHEFVEEHGGTIWVESEEGIGSTFKFVLPIRE